VAVKRKTLQSFLGQAVWGLKRGNPSPQAENQKYWNSGEKTAGTLLASASGSKTYETTLTRHVKNQVIELPDSLAVLTCLTQYHCEYQSKMNGAMPSRHPQNLEHPDFGGLLRRLDPDTKRGTEKYENLRRRLAKFFEYNAGFSASEDLANLTLDTVARKPSDFEIHEVVAYSYGVARKILMEFQRRRARERHLDDSIEVQALAPEPDPEMALVTAIDLQRRVEYLNHCLRKLSTEDRDLALEYYNAQEPTHIAHRQDLARRLGISMNNLWVRVNRIRDTLEECMQNHLAIRTRREKRG